MQGKASLRSLEYLIYNAETANDYQHWKDREGRWRERRDVWIWTTDKNRSGNLKPGFGSDEMKLGPELAFGWLMGEAFDEQVLIIKTCWGGRSVRKDFLSPSSSMPSAEQLAVELERARKRNPEATLESIRQQYGRAYRDMISHVREVLSNLKSRFPDYREQQGYELSGFVWFQGWNDMVDREQRSQKYSDYTLRLANIIRDMRNDLEAPGLPVVIGELGAGGKRGDFQLAQAAVAEQADLQGNVACVQTCEFWDHELEKLVQDDTWKGPNWVNFYNRGSDRAYHYLGSASIYSKIGNALGREMLPMVLSR